MPTSAILVIGNEILSGKVVDTNSPFLCRELRVLGVDVERIHVIPDVVETIAQNVREMSESHDFVFTSGGVGPTHDDLTMDGVALAFRQPLELNKSVAERIERAQGHPPNDSQLKMAFLPTGAVLIDSGDLWFPVIVVKNVHIFPGIPELLRKKFLSVRERFRGVPFQLKRVFLMQRESDIAHYLNETLSEFPDLLMGSYPRTGEGTYHVMVTLESRDPVYLGRALDALLARLPAEAVQKVE
ncbi:MAG TPA: molybdopterin-binding protein [Myxococcota bacterium]|nr:molybdopterin-binding protein [Myxococcota bacterium]